LEEEWRGEKHRDGRGGNEPRKKLEGCREGGWKGFGGKKTFATQLEAPSSAVDKGSMNVEKGSEEDLKKDRRRGIFKCLEKSRAVKGDSGEKKQPEKKRKMDIDREEQGDGVKKVKATGGAEENHNTVRKMAGSADRSCETQ